MMGQALQKQNDLVGAVKYLQRAVKDQPTDPNPIKPGCIASACLRLGKSLFDSGGKI